MPVLELFRALGEPTRLKMVERLSSGESHTITSLSKGFRLSRQGVRKHIKVLADSNIIKLYPTGRETVIQLDRDTLDIGKDFISKLESQWEKRLEALRNAVE